MKKWIILGFVFCFSTAVFAQAAVKSVSASTTLVEKNKPTNFYAAENLFDGKWNSWVEGQNDNGVGSIITIELESPVRVHSLRFRNGYGDLKYYRKNNRVKGIDIILNDKYTYSTTLEDTYEFQYVSTYKYTNKSYNKPVKTIKLKITSVYKGTAYNDTCLSEIIVNPSHMPSEIIMDPFSNELLMSYLLQIKKVPEVRITDDEKIEYLHIPNEYDLFMEPDMKPYWSSNMDTLPRNIIVSLFDKPFAIVPSDYTSKHDPVFCRKIDVYTYNNGNWILDNDNKNYDVFMKYVKEAEKKGNIMRIYFHSNGYGCPKKYFSLNADGTYYFEFWNELKEVNSVD